MHAFKYSMNQLINQSVIGERKPSMSMTTKRFQWQKQFLSPTNQWQSAESFSQRRAAEQ